jgi:hypothetical protein
MSGGRTRATSPHERAGQSTGRESARPRRVLPSHDDAVFNHPGPEAVVSVGSSRESFVPIGSNLPDFDNYYCRDCGRIVHVRKGSPDFRQCPTPECSRPTGFGIHAMTPRPRGAASRRPDSRPGSASPPRTSENSNIPAHPSLAIPAHSRQDHPKFE